jgi:Predicted transcriptional regulators
MEVVSLQQLDYKMIGKRIQSARKDAHMTQDDLADKCGCTGKYVSNIETGKKTPSLDLLTKISSALEVTVDSLLIDSPLAFSKYYVDAVIEKKISQLSKPYLVALNDALDSLLKLQYATEYKDDTSM